jgi:uncharacterized membrane protein YcaP (DUF421 family)
MPFILKPILLYIIGVFLLRISGRRSISQMTISQTILIISLGHILVEPFADKDMTKTISVAVIFTALLVIFEVIEFYSKSFEKIITGKEKTIVIDGELIQKNMKNLKLTEDELLSRLRQEGINKIKDIKKATIEPNGKLGYELKKSAQPITIADMEFIINRILKDDEEGYIDLINELEEFEDDEF